MIVRTEPHEKPGHPRCHHRRLAFGRVRIDMIKHGRRGRYLSSRMLTMTFGSFTQDEPRHILHERGARILMPENFTGSVCFKTCAWKRGRGHQISRLPGASRPGRRPRLVLAPIRGLHQPRTDRHPLKGDRHRQAVIPTAHYSPTTGGRHCHPTRGQNGGLEQRDAVPVPGPLAFIEEILEEIRPVGGRQTRPRRSTTIRRQALACPLPNCGRHRIKQRAERRGIITMKAPVVAPDQRLGFTFGSRPAARSMLTHGRRRTARKTRVNRQACSAQRSKNNLFEGPISNVKKTFRQVSRVFRQPAIVCVVGGSGSLRPGIVETLSNVLPQESNRPKSEGGGGRRPICKSRGPEGTHGPAWLERILEACTFPRNRVWLNKNLKKPRQTFKTISRGGVCCWRTGKKILKQRRDARD